MVPTTQTTDQKLTALRIQRALAKPGAQGKKGFLLWVEAAFPKAMADKIVNSVRDKVDPTAPSPNGLAGFGYFGDVTLANITLDDMGGSSSTDPTVPPVSATTAATSSTPADTSWLSSISSAIAAAGQAYLTKTQVDAANSIFQTNLQRAQQGLAPLPVNPSSYGLPAPTANIGLTSGTQTALLVVAGIFGVAILGGALAKSRKR